MYIYDIFGSIAISVNLLDILHVVTQLNWQQLQVANAIAIDNSRGHVKLISAGGMDPYTINMTQALIYQLHEKKKYYGNTIYTKNRY